MLTAADVQKSFHYLYPSELPALKMLVLQLPSNSLVVNIGAGAGTSGLAIFETRRDLILVTIDIQNESSPFGCLEGERQVMKEAGYGDEYERRWFQLHGDSKFTGQNFKRLEFRNGHKAFMAWGPVNMVFIDGDHSYEGCKGDIEAWMPHLAPGGIMAVHDYKKADLLPDPDGPHPMNWPGVDSAVNELLLPNFEMILHVASLVAFRR